MTETATLLLGNRRGRPAPYGPDRPGQKKSPHRAETVGAWILLAPYVLIFLVAAGIPIVYAFVISMQKAPTLVDPTSGFGGFSSFVTVVTDYRFWDTFINIGTLLVIWLPIMMIGVISLALLIHSSHGRFGGAMRFIYYIPGALSGIANFVLWVYLIDPQRSPIAFLWQGMGATTFKEVITPGNMPGILTAMLFFQGVGTWIVVVNGGLNGIPEEVLEAATIDGANAFKLAWHIKLPLIRPWIGYAALMNVAYGFQLFLEPYLLRQISSGSVVAEWAPTQLGYAFAFTNRNFPAAAAMSIILLVITLAIGLLIVFRSGLFGDERSERRRG